MSFYCLHLIKKSHSRKYVCMFSLQQGLALFCQTVEECWDPDPEARLTADCAQTRLQELLLTSKSAWQPRLRSHVHFMHLGVASTPRQLKTGGFRYREGIWKGSPKGTGKNADIIYSQSRMAEWRSTKKYTRHTSGNGMETKTDQSSYRPVFNWLIWNVQDYAKPLLWTRSFTVCFSGAEATTMATAERQKSNRSRLAKQQLCTCITLFCTIVLPLLHHYNVKLLKPGFHMIATIAVIAAIVEEKVHRSQDHSDHTETTFQRS